MGEIIGRGAIIYFTPCKLNKELDDECVWKRRYNCHYTVKYAHNKLSSKDHRVGREAFHKLWKIKSTPTSMLCG